jgi:hypothetical protein
MPKAEHLYSNLLQVSAFSESLYVAETKYRERKDLWPELNGLDDKAGGEWILRNKHMISFHNLREYPWSKICDVGTVERFDSAEWAYSQDEDAQREFVELLNACLWQKVWPFVKYDQQ